MGPVHEAAATYRAAGHDLVVVAGRNYGAGSSRDWAAKAQALLGVRAVIAESFERIHRNNLIGMGVLPLEFEEGDTASAHAFTGEEEFTFDGLADLCVARTPSPCPSSGPTHPAPRSVSGCASTRARNWPTCGTAGSCRT